MTKVALITGGAKGIGEEIVKKLASKGYNVCINYNKSEKEGENLAKFVESTFKVKAKAYKADVSNESEVKKMIEEIFSDFSRIDVLVNNAGIDITCEYLEKTTENFLKTLKVNLLGPFIVSKYVGPIMTKQKYGKIVNISSNDATKCYCPTTCDYDVSKAGVDVLTKDMAIEFAPHVNVNAVAPGWIDTEMNDEILQDEFVRLCECKKILKNRIGKKEDVANLVAFLISDEAEYINGEIITIDGGQTATRD